MVSSIGSSLAGVNSAATRFAVAAGNIANQHSTSTVVDGVSVNEPYKPQRVVVSSEGGVPVAKVEDVANPTQKLYLPESEQADEYGFVAVPNVDQAAELVNMQIAAYDYKANLKAIQIQNNIEQSLLDILS